MSYRIVRITRSVADDRTFVAATEASEEASKLSKSETEAGVEYAIAHTSYPLFPEDQAAVPN